MYFLFSESGQISQLVASLKNKIVNETHRYLYSKRYIVEPPNKGHFGIAPFVLCKEVVLIRRFKMYKYKEELLWDLQLSPL